DGARAAHAVLAPDVRAREAQLVAQEVGEEQPRLDGALVSRAIDGNTQRHAQGAQRYALAVSAARRQNSSMLRREALAKLTPREPWKSWSRRSRPPWISAPSRPRRRSSTARTMCSSI